MKKEPTKSLMKLVLRIEKRTTKKWKANSYPFLDLKMTKVILIQLHQTKMMKNQNQRPKKQKKHHQLNNLPIQVHQAQAVIDTKILKF